MNNPVSIAEQISFRFFLSSLSSLCFFYRALTRPLALLLVINANTGWRSVFAWQISVFYISFFTPPFFRFRPARPASCAIQPSLYLRPRFSSPMIVRARKTFAFLTTPPATPANPSVFYRLLVCFPEAFPRKVRPYLSYSFCFLRRSSCSAKL